MDEMEIKSPYWIADRDRQSISQVTARLDFFAREAGCEIHASPFQQSSRRGCAERRGMNINKKNEPMKMKRNQHSPASAPPVQTGGMEQPFIGTPCGRRHGRRTAGGGETVTTLTF